MKRLAVAALLIVGACAGQTGPQGPAGPTGPQGPQGAPGPSGTPAPDSLLGVYTIDTLTSISGGSVAPGNVIPATYNASGAGGPSAVTTETGQLLLTGNQFYLLIQPVIDGTFDQNGPNVNYIGMGGWWVGGTTGAGVWSFDGVMSQCAGGNGDGVVGACSGFAPFVGQGYGDTTGGNVTTMAPVTAVNGTVRFLLNTGDPWDTSWYIVATVSQRLTAAAAKRRYQAAEAVLRTRLYR